MTIDYVEEILKLKRKINKREISIDDVITDEMLKVYDTSGALNKTLQHGVSNGSWIPATIKDGEKWSDEMIVAIKQYIADLK